MTPQYVAERTFEAIEGNQELVVLPKYLMPAVVWSSFWQVAGFLNFPNVLDNDHAMAVSIFCASLFLDLSLREQKNRANLHVCH